MTQQHAPKHSTMIFRLIGLAVLFGSAAAVADPSGSGLIYTSLALNPAIHSYPAPAGTERRVAKPETIYVDPAYGQAIYSYPRVGRDSVAALVVRYVNPAYGPAIYSYPGLEEPTSTAALLPLSH